MIAFFECSIIPGAYKQQEAPSRQVSFMLPVMVLYDHSRRGRMMIMEVAGHEEPTEKPPKSRAL